MCIALCSATTKWMSVCPHTCKKIKAAEERGALTKQCRTKLVTDFIKDMQSSRMDDLIRPPKPSVTATALAAATAPKPPVCDGPNVNDLPGSRNGLQVPEFTRATKIAIAGRVCCGVVGQMDHGRWQLNQFWWSITADLLAGARALSLVDRHHFDLNLSDLLDKSTQHKRNWLLNAIAARQRFERQQANFEGIQALSIANSKLIKWMTTGRAS